MRYIDEPIFHGLTGRKLLASFGSPSPLYLASDGYDKMDAYVLFLQFQSALRQSG